MKSILAALLSSFLLLPIATAEELTPLFDGKSLDSFRKAGGEATYELENGEIVGKVGPGANTFLVTKKLYGDFTLELEMKWDVPGNSGIQIRSHQRPGENGRVFGYQCELDPSPRAWTGGIYDEARRGWLYPLSGDKHAAARKAVKLDDWNKIRIEAHGPWIRTWINGVACANLVDCKDLSGFIAFQVHRGAAGQIRWRNLKLADHGTRKWKPLFNGKDTSNWDAMPGGKWEVIDGILQGTAAASERRHGQLISKEQYTDFAVRVVYKANKGNSGVYFRVDKTKSSVAVRGFQAEIDPEKDAGGLYETGGRAWVVKPKPADVKKWYRPEDWNEMTVAAIGKRVVVHVNGYKTAELIDDPGRTQGHIALQLHGGQDMDVQFKSVELVDLSDLSK